MVVDCDTPVMATTLMYIYFYNYYNAIIIIIIDKGTQGIVTCYTCRPEEQRSRCLHKCLFSRVHN